MYSVKTVTRETVLAALREEPLCAGRWFGGMLGESAISDACQVCAVGAVLRRTLDPNTSTNRALAVIADHVQGLDIQPRIVHLAGDAPVDACDLRATLAARARHLVALGRHLAALSYYFEGRWNIEWFENYGDPDIERVRADTLAFVESSFPHEFEMVLA